ncbi:MAG: 4-(cytidine 5'-diphospho)-2-C-methyl-D-erythritol kinase [Candidatus Omnitrophica bacterium]|nr:4-(cytidine 5'-diphospho)-2-C-methyl-D-erythritol kinase [Candidatus Omnitrophota bacterium]MDE2010019.1 4-(cytidine 5'-diphospho)-2-C-methyl-D-erythritol kinase [Candidatus Omnitrophota bacterium]MDE2215051.1 4-(cytidine 5'-diphospho)-2-C-methyl-D-erythritol kinase [Candidatus Omnitrophota bacterium]MDE2231751.1 4-(cytidine 5'-diphospho)-2-C-methyl-D-erythritol kinase [Candidatus Omnitrophota bacterium]
MPDLTVLSPAKINLVLDVLAKRPDGFHELRTVFERISLADTIALKSNKTNAITIRCSHPHVPRGSANLVYKAAAMLRQDFSIAQGVSIAITKRIPVAAGLAGGSSNAAAVLSGLNRLWRLGLGTKELAYYASRIGSDVAFFLYNTSYALGEGRGEKIRPLNVKAKLWHLIVTPRVKMHTKKVFARLKLNLTNKKDNVNILLPFLRKGDVARLAGALSNDLEPAILSLRPHFIYIKRKLIDAGAAGVCFSGSGPSVFALAQSQKHAFELRARFDKRYTQAFVVSTL